MAAPETVPKIRKPKVRSRSSRKLLVLLFIFFIILLAVLFFNSSLSKIQFISISGNHYISQQELAKATQIEQGDRYFLVRSSTIRNRLMNRFKALQNVIVEKSFPGKIHITIQEYEEVGFELKTDGSRVALLANCTEIAVGPNRIVDKPILTGWGEDQRGKQKLCKVLSTIPPSLLADISEIMPFSSEAYPDKIKMYTRSHFEVTTAVSFLKDKIEYMRAIIANKAPGNIVMLDAISYKPFKTKKETTQ